MTRRSIASGQPKRHQRLVDDDSGEEFLSRFGSWLLEHPVNYRRANKDIASEYRYPKEHKVTGIVEQVETLRCFFPELEGATFDKGLTTRPLPPNAEGWFAIPRQEELGLNYGEAVSKVLDAVGRGQSFTNYRGSRLGLDYLRQHVKTRMAFQKLGKEQKGHGILMVPCQFGLRHRGRSAYRARAVMDSSEFGLGALAVGVMLLTHAYRLVSSSSLSIGCAGDWYSPDASGQFKFTTYFTHYFGLRFDACRFDIPDHYGSASGFLS